MRPNLFSTSILPAMFAVAATIGVIVAYGELKPPPELSRPAPTSPQAQPQPSKGAASPVAGSDTPVTVISVPLSAEPNRSEKDPWLANVLKSFAWPLTIIVALLLLAFNSRIRRYLGFAKVIRKISAGGVEMTLDADAMNEVRKQLRDSFAELVESARNEYERAATVEQIPALIRGVLENDLNEAIKDAVKIPGLRATVHVQDVVFPEYLYQVVDYEPRGEGADRRFSAGYGIIGRAWRLRRSLGSANVFGTGATEGTAEQRERNLIEQWGMDRRQASGHPNGRPSSLGVILRDEGVPVGILYIDSTKIDAFGDESSSQAVAEKIETSAATLRLARAVSAAMKPLQMIAPNLRISNA